MGSNPRFCIIGESWGPADALSASGAAAVGTTAAEAAAAKTASAEAAASGAAAKASAATAAAKTAASAATTRSAHFLPPILLNALISLDFITLHIPTQALYANNWLFKRKPCSAL